MFVTVNPLIKAGSLLNASFLTNALALDGEEEGGQLHLPRCFKLYYAVN